MRHPALTVALALTALALAPAAWAEKPPALADDASPVAPPAPITAPAARPLGSHLGMDVPVVGTQTTGSPITGDLCGLAPSARLTGREQALRFRFQQQIQTGDVPWTPRTWRD
jgi:hypothetical protein